MAIESWPAGLPVPQKSFDCQLWAGLADDQEQINSQRTRTYPEHTSNFFLILTQTQFETLQAFYQTTLNGGGELFEADWLEDGGFEYHRLRFLKPFEANLHGGIRWKVKMNLEIIAGVPFISGSPAYWLCGDPLLPDEYGYIYGGDQQASATNKLDCDEYNVNSNTWASKSDMPLPARAGLAASTINSSGYVYGGYDYTSFYRDCDEYTLDVWANKTNIPTPWRGDCAASTLDNSSYIYSGRDTNSTYLQDCDEYTPDVWASKSNVPAPTRAYLASSVVGNRSYIYGGLSTACFRDCDQYIPDVWTSKSDIPLPARRAIAASTIGGNSYIYGGQSAWAYNYLQDCDQYTPNVWTSKTNIPLPARSYLAGSTINGNSGHIYGGQTFNAVYIILQDCDQYTPDVWVSKSDMPAPTRKNLATSTI